MKIEVKESTMIRPAQDLSTRCLWLSNLDILHEINLTPTVYLYKPANHPHSCDAKVLRDALSKVLVPFYPVAGRLRRDDNGRLEINCNNEGVLFIEAETDSEIDDLGDLMLNQENSQLIPSVDYSQGISSNPLFGAQVTAFKCGGLSVGLQFHHALADGFGALHFINTWCDVARGLSNTLPPFVDRTILRCRVPPTPKFEHIEYDKPLSMDSPTQINTLQQNCIEIFKITPQQLETLKTKVKNNNGKTKSTSYEILTAHIWRCTCKARGLSDHQPTKLRIAVDGRSRLDSPLPPGFFGNVIFSATPIALSGEILSEPIGDTVERIDKEIKRMDDEYLRSAIDRLEVLDDLKPILIGANSCRCPNLIVVSWVRLPFYDADFGMGKPACVRPANPPEGKGCILQAPSDDGSWALEICLQEYHMQSFQR
ncbi:shikimate O-hydroxycinnamoyltransferase-like isoform X2 [Hevea brasiliensis]|nr:shikimate O-hydroxycinnamoyltransferase-like isoform X2 [Hevea brasiliensis]